jgi:hypothetical protein
LREKVLIPDSLYMKVLIPSYVDGLLGATSDGDGEKKKRPSEARRRRGVPGERAGDFTPVDGAGRIRRWPSPVDGVRWW